MKKLLISLLVLSFAFSASTNWQNTRVAGKATRTIPLALGASVTNTLTGTSSITLDVKATTGRTSLGQIQTLSNQGVAISTIDVVVLSDMVIGDIVLFQTERSSEDVVFVDDASTILLGGATRTLSDPADVLGLMKISATAVREIIFVDNK
jgi:hypothetical protein